MGYPSCELCDNYRKKCPGVNYLWGCEYWTGPKTCSNCIDWCSLGFFDGRCDSAQVDDMAKLKLYTNSEFSCVFHRAGINP